MLLSPSLPLRALPRGKAAHADTWLIKPAGHCVLNEQSRTEDMSQGVGTGADIAPSRSTLPGLTRKADPFEEDQPAVACSLQFQCQPPNP
jgi:hypothetical protein